MASQQILGSIHRSILKQSIRSLRGDLLRRSARAISTEAYKHYSNESSNVTVLPNGIRVATQQTPGHFSAVGVYVDTGSRYETARTRGVSHIIDRLAFKSTTNRTAEQMLTELESLGGSIMASSSREVIMYQSAIFHQDLPRMVSLFSDVIRRAVITPEEVEEQKQTAKYEIDEIWAKPEMILPEILHSVAYEGNTLGNPLLCPAENLHSMSCDTIRSFMKTWFRPERIVIAAAGPPHDSVVRVAEESFGNMPRSPPEDWLDSVETHADTVSSGTSNPHSNHSIGSTKAKSPSLYKSLSTAASSFLRSSPALAPMTHELEPTPAQLARFKSHYTGGHLHLSQPSLPHTHIYIGLEGLPIHDPDIYTLATLQVLMGGGGSFSAGGPGKGMYSRLFTNVLNQYYWVESCVAFNHCYTDSGLFGIVASCDHMHTNEMLHAICTQLGLVASDNVFDTVTEQELARARNQLKSSLLMNLESRMIQLEDLGRQVQVRGRSVPISEMCDNIDRVTLHDLRRVARRVIRGEVSSSSGGTGGVTCVVQGNLNNLPDVERICSRYGIGKTTTIPI